MDFGVKGQYRLEVKHDDGSVDDTGWFDNLILDQGIVNLLSGSLSTNHYASTFHIGTNNTPPTASQTGLVARAAVKSISAETNTTRSPAGAPTFATTYITTCVWNVGEVVGNMSEVGVGWSNTVTSLFSRALITDQNGIPTTLTLISTDQLTMYYSLTLLPPTGDITGTLTLNGVETSYVGRAAALPSWFNSGSWLANTTTANIGSLYNNSSSQNPAGYIYPSTSTIGDTTAIPSGVGVSFWVGSGGPTASVSHGAVTNNTRPVTLTFGTSQGNGAGAQGIKCIMIGTGVSFPVGNNGTSPYTIFQYEFTPPIAKDNTKALTLTFNFGISRV